jgi:hypothetical protein
MTDDEAPRKMPQGKAASVDVIENPRVVSSRAARRQAAFVARHENNRVDSDMAGPEAGVVIMERGRLGRVTMYKPMENGSFVPRTVAVSSMRLLLKEGWSEFCPKCGGDHLDRNGQPTTDPNACPNNPRVAVRRCPVCLKRIYDNMAEIQPVTSDELEDDPNLIPDEVTLTTPEQRTRLQLDLHLWRVHPRQAQMMGRPSLPGPLREIAESAQAAM